MRTTSLPLGEAPTPVKQVAHKGQDKSCQKGKNKPEEHMESKKGKKNCLSVARKRTTSALKELEKSKEATLIIR